MNIIQNNPYRTVGLLVGTTVREQEKQIRRLKQLIEAEAELPEDYSFPLLGTMYRSVDSVTEAASKLNLDNDKMNAALFWFYLGNAVTDEPAFEAIKKGDLVEVIKIWTNLTNSGEVSHRNASAYSNLAILYLSGILQGTDNFDQGIFLKLKFLESDFTRDLKALATDETFVTNKKELQLMFLNQVQSEIEQSGIITSNKLLYILTNQEFSAKEDFLKSFVQNPIKQIENKIDEAKTKRKTNAAKSIEVANRLLNDTKELLKQIKLILETSNIKYCSISDKLAMEFFACGYDYFIHFKDTSIDPSDATMKLYKKAKSYAVGNIAKQEIDENIKELEKWKEAKPLESDLKSLIEILQEFDIRSKTIENAKILINKCKPILANIKVVLGSSDDIYLKFSTQVAMKAKSNIVEEVNETIENLEYKIRIDKDGTNKKLKTTLSNAWTVTTLVGSLDMEDDFKTNYYNRDKEMLKGLCNQCGVSTSSTYKPTTSSSSSSSQSEFSFADNVWWIYGIAGLVIGLLADLGAGSIILGLICAGIGIGSKIFKLK